MQELNVRDLFAAVALMGLIAHNGANRSNIPMAYDIAEAMLLEKEERDGE